MIRLAVAVMLLAALPAHAEKLTGIPEKAKALADRGRQLQHEQNYNDAIEAYKAAYVLAPSPGLLYNLAQAYRLAGDCPDAAWMYRRFLQTDPDGELKTLAQTHLGSLEKCNNTTAFRIIEPSEVPSPAVTVSAPLALAIDVSAPVDPAQRYKRMGTGLVVGGGAALVAAALFAFDAHEQASTVDDAYNGKGMAKDVMSVDERGKRDVVIATVLGVGGVVAAASGAIFYGLGRHYEKHVAFVPHTGGAGVSMSWGF